jgi:hypothetical protein
MKTKHHPSSQSELIRLHTKPVRYRWSTPDGTVCHGSSVVLARTRAGLRQALRNFWHQHTHVSPEEA